MVSFWNDLGVILAYVGIILVDFRVMSAHVGIILVHVGVIWDAKMGPKLVLRPSGGPHGCPKGPPEAQGCHFG